MQSKTATYHTRATGDVASIASVDLELTKPGPVVPVLTLEAGSVR